MKRTDVDNTVAAAALFAGSAAFAQSTLFAAEQLGGTLDPPSLVTAPPRESARGMPSRTDSSLSAFDKLDWENRGYVTRSDANQLGNINFDSADRDRGAA